MANHEKLILVPESLLRELLHELQIAQDVMQTMNEKFGELGAAMIKAHLRAQKALGNRRGKLIPLTLRNPEDSA